MRWYNRVTGEYSWEDPLTITHWRTVTSEDGPFYYNIQVRGHGEGRVPFQPPIVVRYGK